MIPRVLLGTAAIPGGGELRLFRRGDEFSIMLGSNELMNSRKSGSEEALASLAFPRSTHHMDGMSTLHLGTHDRPARLTLSAVPSGRA